MEKRQITTADALLEMLPEPREKYGRECRVLLVLRGKTLELDDGILNLRSATTNQLLWSVEVESTKISATTHLSVLLDGFGDHILTFFWEDAFELGVPNQLLGHLIEFEEDLSISDSHNEFGGKR